jgi:protein regulator of cytokinesis 1
MQLKDIVASLYELWNLMDSSKEEMSKFSRITYILGNSEPEITQPGFLSTDIIEQVAYQSHIS